MTLFLNNYKNNSNKNPIITLIAETQPLTLSGSDCEKLVSKVKELPGFNDSLALTAARLINQLWQAAEFAEFNYNTLYDCVRALDEFLTSENKTLSSTVSEKDISTMASNMHQFIIKSAPRP